MTATKYNESTLKSYDQMIVEMAQMIAEMANIVWLEKCNNWDQQFQLEGLQCAS